MEPWATRLKCTSTPLMTLTKLRSEKPVTPAEAQVMVEEDWIFQADEARPRGGRSTRLGWSARARRRG